MDEAHLSKIKGDLSLLANPPKWFRGLAGAMIRVERLFGGSLMRHSLGQKAQTRTVRMLVAIDSMTMAERLHPERIDYGRLERISRGSGVSLFDAQLAAHYLAVQQKRAETK